MALKFGRSTVKTQDPPTNIIIKQEKQTRPKTPERIAKEAKYNANLEVYNQSKADQSSAESEYSSSMGKYNENMKTYNEMLKTGTPIQSQWGASLNKEQLARVNAANQRSNPGMLSSSRIRVPKGGDPESFTKDSENNTTKGLGLHLPEYVKPQVPSKRKTTSVSEPVQDWEEDYLPTMKVTGISTKKGKIIPAKEDVTWEAPVMTEKKGSRMGYTKIKPGGKPGIEGAAQPFNKKYVGPNKIKYNTEQRRSAAYYGDNTSTGEKITGKTESELRQLKKETRGEFGRVLKEGRLGDALTIGKDLSQIRRATRYTKDADLSVGSTTGVTMEGEGSNLRYFTPEKTRKVTQDGRQVRGEGAMAGYKEFQTQEKGKVFRAQYENATNRNTIANQQATNAAAATPTSSFSSSVVTRGQMKDKYKENNPTASPRQVRQGVRAEAAANREIIKAVVSKQKEK
jgi:hypothetical protein